MTIPGSQACCSTLPDAEIVLSLIEHIGTINNPCCPDDFPCTGSPFEVQCEQGVIGGCTWEYAAEDWDAFDVENWCIDNCGPLINSDCDTHVVGHASMICANGAWNLVWRACQNHGSLCGNCGCNPDGDLCECTGTMTEGCACPTDEDVDWGVCASYFD